MKLSIINPDTLTYNTIVKHLDELYVVSLKDGSPFRDKPIADIEPFAIYPEELEKLTADHLIVRITEDDALPSEEEDISADREPEKPMRLHTRLAYKIDASNKDKTIFVEGRPNGDIRVSFVNREEARVYHEYIRDLFYCHNKDVQAVNTSLIYKELHMDIQNDEFWKACERFGWLTIEGGPCKYISESVMKTRDAKTYGFTLKRPIRLFFKEREQ